MKIEYNAIGLITTPYEDMAPFSPEPEAKGEFSIIVNKDFLSAIQGLDAFSHIIVYFHFDRSQKTNLKAHPPHLKGGETGLFASRSPNRINKIGMDIVKVLSIQDNVIHTSPMDILNNTPLLDIKPYIPALDTFPNASRGHSN